MPTTYAIPDGRTVMAATLYTGNNSTNTITNTVNGVSFQPDIVWMKCRSNVTNHVLDDAVRGAGVDIYPNLTNAQSSTGVFTAFNSNGFSLGADGGGSLNGNGLTYVGWQWKESASSGFDIVSQTLSTTGINTITHNLGVIPQMVFAKRTNGTEQWLVYHASATTQSQYLGLNTTAAVATSANLWGSSAFTSSQIYFSGTSGNVYVFYIFANVAGYSAFGSYTGNGSSDGPFVYLGFRPRFVLLKRADGVDDWQIVDTSRDTYNPTPFSLVPNTTAADATTNWMDILSNGFKIRQSFSQANGSGGTYIYAAFAENPFKYANAR